ncbi:MAG: N-acetylmuramoyl-L-alanine amidase [Acidimicrobiales bacterium]
MRPRRPAAWRRAVARGVGVAAVAVLGATGLALPAAPPTTPVLEAKAHDIADQAVAAGRSVQVDTGLPTEAVGVDWNGTGDGAVEVRALDGGSWTPWLRLEGNPTEGPDVTSPEHRARTGAGPLWVGHGVGKVEVRVVEGDLRGLRLHAIRSEDPPGGGLRPAAAVVGQPPIVSRAAWGADESYRHYAPGCGQPGYADAVHFAVLHHTATANDYTPADGPALVRAIYYFHTHTNLWCDIGYNLLVDRYGQVYEGRYGGVTRPVIGAHAAGFNTGSTGVALIGTFQTDAVPQAMYTALRGLLDWKLAYHGVNPLGTVAASGTVVPALAGHRDLNSTDCPGDLAYGLLTQLRGQVAAAVSAAIDKPAVARGPTYYLRGWPSSGPADTTFSFGDATDVRLLGDWDGTHTRTPGVFRNGAWYLRNSDTTGVADVSFGFGDAGDIPVVGDWNGDGVDTPGVVRNGVWYLRNSNTTGTADVVMGFGNAGDVPVVGDWAHLGRDTPGVVRNGTWYLRASTTSGPADASFGYGNTGDVPVVGDWNGDGTSTPGVVRNGIWYLRNDNSAGTADVTFGFGNTGDRPLAWS